MATNFTKRGPGDMDCEPITYRDCAEHVGACDGCGAEGSLTRVADFLDQPNGTTSLFCGECLVTQ